MSSGFFFFLKTSPIINTNIYGAYPAKTALGFSSPDGLPFVYIS